MSKETIMCPKCGIENSTDDTFCKECGSRLKDNTESDKIIHLKNYKNPCSFIELLSYCIIVFLFATVLSYLIVGKFASTIDKLDKSTVENVFQQIYNAIEIVGCGVSICIGAVISLSVVSYIRINQKLNDIYKMLNKDE